MVYIICSICDVRDEFIKESISFTAIERNRQMIFSRFFGVESFKSFHNLFMNISKESFQIDAS